MASLPHLSAAKMIPSRVTQVLQKMQSIYGSNLIITRLTESEIELRVKNMTDSKLIADMMTRKNDIFGSELAISGRGCFLGPPDFQILCEQLQKTGPTGLFLRYLPNTPQRQDYLAGFWFY